MSRMPPLVPPPPAPSCLLPSAPNPWSKGSNWPEPLIPAASLANTTIFSSCVCKRCEQLLRGVLLQPGCCPQAAYSPDAVAIPALTLTIPSKCGSALGIKALILSPFWRPARGNCKLLLHEHLNFSCLICLYFFVSLPSDGIDCDFAAWTLPRS